MTSAASASPHFLRPLAFQFAWIGDQLLALPAMRALATVFPGSLRLLLGQGMLSFFYRGLLASDPVRILWDDYRSGRVDRVAAASPSCDLFLCLSRRAPPFVPTLARHLGATCTVGLGDRFDQTVRVEPGAHVFDQLFSIPRAIAPSVRFDEHCAPPRFSPAAEESAARFAGTLRQHGARILFVHPETEPEKSWPQDRFAWVVERFLGERPEYSVVVSSLAPISFDRHDRVTRIDFHLELALALVRHADLFLGVDSCFLHAADLFRVPGVALFGPTDPGEWGFRLAPSYRHVSGRSIDRIRPEPVLSCLLDLAETIAPCPSPIKTAP